MSHQVIVKAKPVYARAGVHTWITGYQLVHPKTGRLMGEVRRSEVHNAARRLTNWPDRVRIEFVA